MLRLVSGKELLNQRICKMVGVDSPIKYLNAFKKHIDINQHPLLVELRDQVNRFSLKVM